MPSRAAVPAQPLGPTSLPRTVLLLGVTLVAGCGGSTDEPPSSAPPSSATALVDAEGGELATGSATLLVPEGALDAAVEVTLTELTDVPRGLPTGRERLAPVVKLTPHGTTFAAPVQLRMGLDRRGDRLDPVGVVVYRLDDDDDATWEELSPEEGLVDVLADIGEVHVKLDHFSFYVVTQPAPSGCATELPPHVCDEALVWPGQSCESAWDSCGEGTVLGMDPAEPCPVCVPSEADETCAEASAGLSALLAHMASKTCANWCATDDDCWAWRVETPCGTGCYALYGGIDEEPLLAAEVFARDHCGVCGSTETRVENLGQVGRCEQQRCVLPADVEDLGEPR